MTLQEEYNKIVEKYLEIFYEKHGLELEYWVQDNPGTIGQFGDYFFGFDDIRYDIDNNIPKDRLIEWYDFNLEYSEKTGHSVNYRSF